MSQPWPHDVRRLVDVGGGGWRRPGGAAPADLPASADDPDCRPPPSTRLTLSHARDPLR